MGSYLQLETFVTSIFIFERMLLILRCIYQSIKAMLLFFHDLCVYNLIVTLVHKFSRCFILRVIN